MLVPVRCFTCGGLVGDKYSELVNRVKDGEDPGDVLDALKMKRYCCRRILLSNVDIIDQILPYYEALAKRKEEFASERI